MAHIIITNSKALFDCNSVLEVLQRFNERLQRV
jgi:hypothetical protein